jgi:dipeptidase
MLGKSVEEYSSHIIREPSGESNCPEIQKQTCSSCNASNNMAHDEYFCPKSWLSMFTKLSPLNLDQKNDNNNLPKIAENLQKFLEHKKNPPQSNHYQHQNFSHGGYRRH